MYIPNLLININLTLYIIVKRSKTESELFYHSGGGVLVELGRILSPHLRVSLLHSHKVFEKFTEAHITGCLPHSIVNEENNYCIYAHA